MGRYLYENDLVRFVKLVYRSSRSIGMSTGLAMGHYCATFIVVRIALLFNDHGCRRGLVSDVLGGVDSVVSLLRLDPCSFFPLGSVSSNGSRLDFQGFVSPGVLENLSLRELFSLTLVLSRGTGRCRVFGRGSSGMLASIVTHLGSRLGKGAVSPCCQRIYRGGLCHL